MAENLREPIRAPSGLVKTVPGQLYTLDSGEIVVGIPRGFKIEDGNGYWRGGSTDYPPTGIGMMWRKGSSAETSGMYDTGYMSPGNKSIDPKSFDPTKYGLPAYETQPALPPWAHSLVKEMRLKDGSQWLIYRAKDKEAVPQDARIFWETVYDDQRAADALAHRANADEVNSYYEKVSESGHHIDFNSSKVPDLVVFIRKEEPKPPKVDEQALPDAIDKRIEAVIDPQLGGKVVVVRLGEVGATQARGHARKNLIDVVHTNDSGVQKIGVASGPKSPDTTITPEYFARVFRSELPTLTPKNDRRVMHDFEDGNVVVRLGSVGPNQLRSSSTLELTNQVQGRPSIGSFSGPKPRPDDLTTTPEYYTSVRYSELPTAVAPVPTVAPETDRRILHDFGDDTIVARLRDVVRGARRSPSWDNVNDVIKGSYKAVVGHYSVDGEYDDNYARVYKADLVKLPDAVVAPAEPPVYSHGNSGRRYDFVVGTNSFTGERGWKPVALSGAGTDPAFDPVAPIMAIHDLMEHFPDDEYGTASEYMAQGAMLWLRFEGGFFGGSNMPDQVVKPAFGMLFHHIVKGKLDTPTLESKLGNAELNRIMGEVKFARDTELTFAELINKANVFISNNYDGDRRERLRNSLVNGIPWIRLGYEKARARYAGLDRTKLVRLFRNTASAIENPREGGRLTLTMDYKKYSANVELNYSSVVNA